MHQKNDMNDQSNGQEKRNEEKDNCQSGNTAEKRYHGKRSYDYYFFYFALVGVPLKQWV